MSQKLFYIASVTHASEHTLYVSLFRENRQGYTLALSEAGKYTLDEVENRPDYYNNGCANIAIECNFAEFLAVVPEKGHHAMDLGPCIENSQKNWKAIAAGAVLKTLHPPKPETMTIAKMALTKERCRQQEARNHREALLKKAVPMAQSILQQRGMA